MEFCIAEKQSVAKEITGVLSGEQYLMSDTGIAHIINYEFKCRLNNEEVLVCNDLGLRSYQSITFPKEYKKWKMCLPTFFLDAPNQLTTI